MKYEIGAGPDKELFVSVCVCVCRNDAWFGTTLTFYDNRHYMPDPDPIYFMGDVQSINSWPPSCKAPNAELHSDSCDKASPGPLRPSLKAEYTICEYDFLSLRRSNVWGRWQ